MAENELKDFLRLQARSLDTLLALTPAKNMFGEDVSDQWKRKKQTPEQKRAARIAKLDPANWKSAKDVYDERDAAAKKRKRGEEEARNGNSGLDHSTSNDHKSKRRKNEIDKVENKKPPTNHERIENVAPDQINNPNFKKRMKKRLHAQEKKQQLLESKIEQKREKQSAIKTESVISRPARKQKTAGDITRPETLTGGNESKESLFGGLNEPPNDVVTRAQDKTSEDQASGEETDTESDSASTAPSSSNVPDILSPLHDSASSSASSIPAGPTESVPKKKPTSESAMSETADESAALRTKSENLPSEEAKQAARKRLQEHISQFRSQRKADEKPARSRAELLEQRRRKEEERKLAKKEQKRKEREEEARKQDEEMVRRFSPGGSGSLLASPRSPLVDDTPNGSFNFGRIAFDDGTHLDSSTFSAAGSQKQKGAADPATALKAAQSKAMRLSGLDEEKRKDIEEKDMWLKAKKRAHGERVRDDTSLLKKALKRQDKHKNRSEQEWDKRIEGVRAGQDAKQKKRTENLQKRKDEKLARKSGKKKVKRPGFEGSFRGRTGKTK